MGLGGFSMAFVEGQEVRVISPQFGGVVHLLVAHGEMGKAPLELEERLRWPAAFFVLLLRLP